MSAHTPGPWTLEFSNCGDIDPLCPGGWRIHGPRNTEPHGFHNETDARLIAAAPDLLAALKELVRETEHCDNPRDAGVGADSEVVEAARVAIAKAEGA